VGLDTSHVSRNLNAQVVLFGLEIGDLLILLVFAVAGMLIGQFVFPDRYLFFLPMNWALMLAVCVVGVPGLMVLKYGKPKAYTADLLKWFTQPKAFSCLEPPAKPFTPYIAMDTEDTNA
jgi:hypothetical protein